MECFGMPVDVDNQDDGSVVVSDSIINMYGVGESLADAIDDYKATVLEYYWELEMDSAKLGDNLKNHLEYLRWRIRPKS